nr:hypothetical protein [Tanacetum cinerariifolium]
MIIVKNESVIDTSDLQTELERTKERFENYIIKKETEYAKLWNDWYKKCDECKYDKISYDKAYNDMQQKIERLQAQLGDLHGKSKDTSSVSDTRNPLSQKLENKNVELEFKVLNYARENAHLKATYKNLFDSISVSRQFCDSDLEVTFRRNACFVRNLEGVDLLKGVCSSNLYTINLHEMASASPICLMARASSTKSWLWHQRMFRIKIQKKYQPKVTKTKKLGTPESLAIPKPRKSRLLLSINGKRYVLVIVDDYSRYTWVHFLRSKDEAPEVIIKFLKRIAVLLQSHVIIIRTDNGTKFKNQVLKEYFDTVGISHQMSSVRTPQQNGVVERRNWTLVEAARTMLIFSRAPLFVWAEAIATACFTQNRFIIHYIGKLSAKGDIGFFIGSGLDLTYAPSTITSQQPFEGELDLLFEAMYDDYISGQPSATARTVPPAQEPQVRQSSTASPTIADTAPIPTNSSSLATNIPITPQDGTIDPTLFIRRFQDDILVNDREDIRKLGAKCDIGFFIGYSAESCAYRVYNRLDLTYAPSTITTQQPSEGELDLLFEAMYDDYIGGQPSATARTVPPAQEPQVRQLSMDHPLEQVIEEPSRPILTRNQLRSDGDVCMYVLSVSTMEPKNVKEAMTDPAWIDSMQEELL